MCQIFANLNDLPFSVFSHMHPILNLGYEFKKTQINLINGEKCIFTYIKEKQDNSQTKFCPKCGGKLVINSNYNITLKDVTIGSMKSYLIVPRTQYICTACSHTQLDKIPFKHPKHRMTLQAYESVLHLLSMKSLTYKEVAIISGINKNIIKEIAYNRLINLYTVDGKALRKPERFSEYLSIDEFLLHKNHRYATIIIDIKTGEILWVAIGKKKEVVFQFMDHVGKEWMEHVKAVACDMNSDFEEAFKDQYRHIDIVFDHFHIIKNLNENVIDNIRKDEQKRAKKEEDTELIEALNGSKLILTSNKGTLEKRDQDAIEEKITGKDCTLFHIPQKKAKGGNLEKYNNIISLSPDLSDADKVKNKLYDMYKCEDEDDFKKNFWSIIDTCKGSTNKHLVQFGRMLDRHYEGIVNYFPHKISSGKIEGINQKIKTLRRGSYGIPDDTHFFLRIIDIMSNKVA